MSDCKTTFIGLGQMGAALVPPFLAAGRAVTVWNRSPAKAAPLVAEGAHLAGSLDEALASADLIIVCLANYDTGSELLRDARVAPLLQGKTLLHLTTGDGAQAEEWAHWAKEAGVAYLDGAIMDYPTKVGKPECLLLVSGPGETYDAYASELKLLGGGMTYVGDKPSTSNLLDGGLLTLYYGNTFSLMQSAAMLMAEGVGIEVLKGALEAFKPVIDSTWQRTLELVSRGDYSGNEASIPMHLLGVRSLLGRAQAAGIEHGLLQLFVDYLERTAAQGHEDDELPAVFELFRP